MKKEIILFAVLILSILSCSKDSSSNLESYTVYNSTKYDLKIFDYKDNLLADISPKETEKVKADGGIFSIKPTKSTSKFFGYYKKDSNDHELTLYSYDYHIQYKITGTAKTADLTYSEPDGGTGQMSDVAIPHTISYKDFSGESFYYISAQNNDTDGGTIKVEILFNERPYKSASASGFASIATASGN